MSGYHGNHPGLQASCTGHARIVALLLPALSPQAIAAQTHAPSLQTALHYACRGMCVNGPEHSGGPSWEVIQLLAQHMSPEAMSVRDVAGTSVYFYLFITSVDPMMPNGGTGPCPFPGPQNTKGITNART